VVERFAGPVAAAVADLGSCVLTDDSAAPKWRTWTDQWSVGLGKSKRLPRGLVFSVAPGELIIVGEAARPADAVDITHVRAMFRLSGVGARHALEHLCSIDLGDEMTPNGAAARTLVAAVATELVRDDQGEEVSYLLLVSRSFAQHVWDRLCSLPA